MIAAIAVRLSNEFFFILEVIIFGKKEFFNFRSPSIHLLTAMIEKKHMRMIPTDDQGRKTGLQEFYQFVFVADKVIVNLVARRFTSILAFINTKHSS